jgi:hypothetical protein
MSNQFQLSIRPVLVGTIVLLLGACRTDERSNTIDTTTPPQDTQSSQNVPPLVPPELPSSVERERILRENAENMEPYERMPVSGRDDAMELGNGGSSAGSSGTHTAGSGGSAGSSAH